MAQISATANATLPELRINGSDVLYSVLGVRMGDGFIDALTEPLTLKSNIENESRLEHGKRVIIEAVPKFQPREVTLDFTIQGSTPEDLRDRKHAFLSLMYRGNVMIEVPAVSPDVYRLVYKGKGAEYAMSTDRTFCHMMLKFEEPNPVNRGAMEES